MTQCSHVRTLPNRRLAQCKRSAVKDGYCTPHHPDYTDPSTREYLQRMDTEDFNDTTEGCGGTKFKVAPVPVEPTLAMIEACARVDAELSGPVHPLYHKLYRKMWAAMLAAAPEAGNVGSRRPPPTESRESLYDTAVQSLEGGRWTDSEAATLLSLILGSVGMLPRAPLSHAALADAQHRHQP